MKKTFAGVMLLVSLTCITTLHATSSLHVLSSGRDTSLTLYKNAGQTGKYLRLNEIDIHAARHFMKQFSNVTDDKWLKIDGGYLVRFTNEGNRNDAFYDDRGRFIQSSSYFKENDSPAEIKELINKNFPGYTIMVTTKISVGSKTYYRLHISNPNFIKTLEVINTKIYVREDQLNGATVNQ